MRRAAHCRQRFVGGFATALRSIIDAALAWLRCAATIDASSVSIAFGFGWSSSGDQRCGVRHRRRTRGPGGTNGRSIRAFQQVISVSGGWIRGRC
jgi:hypothetical protein